MFPIMREALSGLVRQVQFARIKSVQEKFDDVESAEEVEYFLGSLQPLHQQNLLAKPEGWRRWKWFSLWTTQKLEVSDYVRDVDGLQYRVMSKSDWSQGAYFEYELTQGATIGAVAP